MREICNSLYYDIVLIFFSSISTPMADAWVAIIPVIGSSRSIILSVLDSRIPFMEVNSSDKIYQVLYVPRVVGVGSGPR